MIPDKIFIGIKGESLLKRLIVFEYMLLILSCIGFMPGGAEEGKNLYTIFYTGEEGTQYFIKPLTFGGINKSQLLLDFTFRYKDTVKDSAIVNMSFLNTEKIRDLDSVKITNGSNLMVFKDIKCLFTERRKKEFHSRFSAKGSLADLKKLFDKSQWRLTTYEKYHSGTFTTPRDTEKKVYTLREGVFLLF